MSAEAAPSVEESQPLCRNCGTPLAGPYCSACGQKELEPHEYALGHFLHHALHDVTHFDTKLGRSILPLLTRPGKITSDYLAGRRGRYIRPLQTFLLLNLVFFLFAPRVGLFNFSLHMYENSRAVVGVFPPGPILKAAKARSHLGDEAFRERFDSILHTQRKALVIVMVILFAVATQVMFLDRKRYFVEHLIFALHFYSFWLIVVLVVPLALLGLIVLVKLGAATATGKSVSRSVIGEDVLLAGMFAGCAVYLREAVRRVYGSSRGRSWIQGLTLAFVVLLLILVYRDLLFFTTIALV